MGDRERRAVEGGNPAAVVVCGIVAQQAVSDRNRRVVRGHNPAAIDECCIVGQSAVCDRELRAGGIGNPTAVRSRIPAERATGHCDRRVVFDVNAASIAGEVVAESTAGDRGRSPAADI